MTLRQMLDVAAQVEIRAVAGVVDEIGATTATAAEEIVGVLSAVAEAVVSHSAQGLSTGPCVEQVGRLLGARLTTAAELAQRNADAMCAARDYLAAADEGVARHVGGR